MLASMRKFAFVLLAITSLALTACSSTAESDASSESLDTSGSISVPTGADSRYEGQPCDSFRGVSDRPVEGNFDHIVAGAQVVVTDASGTTIGVSTLQAGELVMAKSGDALDCLFPFDLSDLPDAEFYGVEVGGTGGGVQFTKSEMQAGPSISLG